MRQQNFKVPSAKCCIFAGHYDQNTTLICGYEKCNLDNRWICAKCGISKIHDHDLQTENHIFDQERFYKLLKDQQVLIYKENKERYNKINKYKKQLRSLSQSINSIIQQLEYELLDLKIQKSAQFIDQMIKKTEEDFSQISSQEIIQFHNENIKYKGYIFEQLKEDINKIEMSTQKIKQDVEQYGNKAQIQMNQRENISDDKKQNCIDIEIQNYQSPIIKKSIKLICSIEDIEQQNQSINEIIQSEQEKAQTDLYNPQQQTKSLQQDQPQNNNQDSPLTRPPQQTINQTSDQIFKVSQRLSSPSSLQKQKFQIFPINQNKQVKSEIKIQDGSQQNIFQNDKQSIFSPKTPKQPKKNNQSPIIQLQRLKTDQGEKSDRQKSIQQQQFDYQITKKNQQKNSEIDQQTICKNQKTFQSKN